MSVYPPILSLEAAVAALAPVQTATGYRCHGWEGPCERGDAQVMRQNTQYVDDRQNWVCLCPECAKVNARHWADMWSDYYSDCL